MAHHKRRRPKHQRAGCLFCKPHKDERRKKSMQARDARRSGGAPLHHMAYLTDGPHSDA